MASVTLDSGEARAFTVKGFNKRGRQVPINDVTLSAGDPNIAVATCDLDGNNGLVGGVSDGITEYIATAAGKQDVLTVTVQADTTVDRVEVEVAPL